MDAGFNDLSFSSLVYESDEIIFDYLNSISGLDALSSVDPPSLPDVVPSGSLPIHNDEDSTETNSHEEEYLTFSLLVAPSADSPTCDLPLFTNEDLSFLDDIPTTSSQSKPPPDLLAHCVIDLVSTVEPSSDLYVQLNQECEAKTEDDEQSKGMKFSFYWNFNLRLTTLSTLYRWQGNYGRRQCLHAFINRSGATNRLVHNCWKCFRRE